MRKSAQVKLYETYKSPFSKCTHTSYSILNALDSSSNDDTVPPAYDRIPYSQTDADATIPYGKSDMSA